VTLTRSLLTCLAVVIAVTAIGCTEPRSSARPSSSLLEVEFTPRDGSPGPGETDDATEEPTFVAIPVGWDNAFCAIFADLSVGQELAVDIERAIDEENPGDAKGLARDLRDITADGVGLMEGLPAWEDAADATQQVTTLLDLHGRAATEYLAYFNEETTTLRRARNLRRQISRATPAANEVFAELETLGIACDDQPLVIEEFR
jgi:hypothetical protein